MINHFPASPPFLFCSGKCVVIKYYITPVIFFKSPGVSAGEWSLTDTAKKQAVTQAASRGVAICTPS
jgi:hypothetical protein